MIRKPNRKTWLPWLIAALSVISGCDDRATQIAREAADRQAQQNTEMARLNKEVASGTHQLVEADAQARKEIVGVHRDLQAERSRLDSSWSELENDRRQLAGQRRTESMFVAAAQVISGVFLVTALMGFCGYVLIAARSNNETESELNELLIREFLADDSPLLAGRSRPTALLPQAPDLPD